MQTVELYLGIIRIFLHFFIIGDIWRINKGKKETEEKTEGTSRKEEKIEEERRVENRAEDKRGEVGGER